MKRYKNSPVPYDKFIRAYLKYDTADEVAKELGISAASVSPRATRLRSMGVKLPYKYYYIKDKQSFADEMNELIKSIEGGKNK